MCTQAPSRENDIMNATESLATAFMRCFEEELRKPSNRKIVTELEATLCKGVETLLQQGFSWQQIRQLPSQWHFPAIPAAQCLAFLDAIQESLGPKPMSSAPTPAPTANADKEGVPATPEEKRKRGFAGMPVLPGGQSLAMPLDGFGLSYCCCCGQDAGFRSMMIAENDGLTISRSEERSFRSAARRFNMAVAKRASDAGRDDISRMLQVADWPGGEALQFFAEELGGSLLFGSCCDKDERLFGSGPIALHVYHDLTEPDPDGDSYDKFDLIQSWTLERTPRPGKIRSKRRHHSKLRTTSSSISRDRRPKRQSIASTTDARSKVPRDKNSMADRETPDAERFAAALAGKRRWKNAKRPHHAPVSRP